MVMFGWNCRGGDKKQLSCDMYRAEINNNRFIDPAAHPIGTIQELALVR
tara:strand:+ start:756 stop:902 length:147 start_codon:yes stop_codon:yes gene_type:complete